MDQTYLGKTIEDGEEKFVAVTVDMQAGKMRRMSGAMTEAHVREWLGGNGMPKHELDSLIASAPMLH